jgi:hypothetical protein
MGVEGRGRGYFGTGEGEESAKVRRCEGAKVGRARAIERPSDSEGAVATYNCWRVFPDFRTLALLSSPCLTADLNLNTGFGSCRMRGRSCASGRRG